MHDWQRARPAGGRGRRALLGLAAVAVVGLALVLATDRGGEPLTVEELDPADDAGEPAAGEADGALAVGQWQRLPDVPLEAGAMSAAAWADGAVHVAGSAAAADRGGGLRTEVASLPLDGDGEAADRDAESDEAEWSTAATPPLGGARVTLAAGVGDDLVLLGSGQGTPPAMAALDLDERAWDTAPPPQLGGSRLGHIGEGALLLVRGRDDEPAEVQHYDAATRRWEHHDDAPVVARGSGAVETDGEIAVLGPVGAPSERVGAATLDPQGHWGEATLAPAEPGWQPDWAPHPTRGVALLGPDAQGEPQAARWHPEAGWDEPGWPDPPVTLQPGGFRVDALSEDLLLRRDGGLHGAWLLPGAFADPQDWQPLASPPQALGREPEVVIADDRLVALGGEDVHGEPTTAAFLLDPALDPGNER